MTPAWDCCCEECGQTWGDVFPEDEEGVMCPFCDSEDIDAVRVDADNMPWSENDLWAKVRMRCIACGAVWTGIPSDTTCMNCDEDAGAEATDGR